jgi:acetolactate synthase I/II/III large subunit
MTMKLSDYIIQTIADFGVKHIFLLPGGGCMHLVDSVGSCAGLEFICNLHEQACAISAEAYGQYTNHLGVALVTTGPGGTNAVTGVAGAWLDSTPCLFLSGQVKRADLKGERGVRQMGFQEIDIIRVVSPLTKYAVTVTDPQSIRYHLEKALYLARNGRPGPVWIDVPLDVQAAQIEPNSLLGFDPNEVIQPQSANLLARQVSDAIQLFNQAERPVILVGNGVRLSSAIDEFLHLANLLNVPVLTTWKSIDFLAEDHPLFAGRPGGSGQRGANFTQQNADWLLCLGARLDFGQTGYSHSNFARGAKKIIVDIDSTEIDKLDLTVDLPIVADAGNFMREFITQTDKVMELDRSNWLRRSKTWQAKYPTILPEYWQEQNYVNNYVLIDVLSSVMSSADLLIPGSSGACSEITMQAFKVKSGMRIFNTEGLGSMGFGIPAAIGGCIASDRQNTICIDGDGGFVMNIQELETVKRLNLPIKFFVLNNQGYGSIRSSQKNYFNERYVGCGASSGLTLPDPLKMAQAFGIKTARIDNHQNIEGIIRSIVLDSDPVVCEVMISPQQFTAPRVTSVQRPDGTMLSKPLEDLWPFLDREEFMANMIVPPLLN